MRIYLAGPLFTPYHRRLHAEHARCLRKAGHECFVPQEQEHNTRHTKAISASIFKVDLDGLRDANAMVALLDDPDVSSGAACEMGIFYELALHDDSKKGILGILSDDRPRRRNTSNVGESINFFTLGCVEKSGKVYETINQVIEHLARWQEELE